MYSFFYKFFLSNFNNLPTSFDKRKNISKRLNRLHPWLTVHSFANRNMKELTVVASSTSSGSPKITFTIFVGRLIFIVINIALVNGWNKSEFKGTPFVANALDTRFVEVSNGVLRWFRVIEANKCTELLWQYVGTVDVTVTSKESIKHTKITMRWYILHQKASISQQISGPFVPCGR